MGETRGGMSWYARAISWRRVEHLRSQTGKNCWRLEITIENPVIPRLEARSGDGASAAGLENGSGLEVYYRTSRVAPKNLVFKLDKLWAWFWSSHWGRGRDPGMRGN